MFDFMDLLSLFYEDRDDRLNPEGDGPDPEGEGPDLEGDGPDPEGDRPDSEGDRDNPDSNDNDSDGEDSEPVQRVDKGKRKASTPVSLEEPLIPEEPSVSEEDSEERFQKDLEQAKLNSLKQEDGGVESSKQGAQSELEKEAFKQQVKQLYDKAVEEFNDNMSQIVDNDTIDPEYKEFLIERSQGLRELVDYYKTLKDDLNIYSSEEEQEEEYSSDHNSNEDSGSENSRPAKRPRNN